METVVEVQDLQKVYGCGEAAVHALEGISLSLERESFTALIGRSGSGKSTLLNILGGLDAPTQGRVLLAGQSLFALPPGQRTVFRRSRIGYVFQFFNLLPELTVEENVLLPLRLDHCAPDTDFIQSVLQQLGLWEKRGRYPAQLSGGEQQRTAVARALAIKPLVLLADEPTGNLDSRTGRQLLDLLHHCCRLFQQTVLLATHDLESARTADRILTLEDGRLLDDMRGGADGD